MTSRPPRPCRGRRDCPTLRVGVPGALFRSRAQRTAPPASHPGLRGAAGAHARVPGGADRAVAPLMPTGTLTKSVPRGRANGAAEVKGCVLSHTAPKGGQAGLQFFHPTDWGGGGGNHWPGSPILGVKALCGVHLLCRPRMFTELPRWQISLQAQSSVSSTLPSKTATVPFVAVLPTTEHNL